MADAFGAWLALIILPIVGIGGGLWGLLTITPMTAGWLGCGIAVGLLGAVYLWGYTVVGMDTYMEKIMWFTGPITMALFLFALWCLGVFLWRGIGLHVSVVVH